VYESLIWYTFLAVAPVGAAVAGGVAAADEPMNSEGVSAKVWSGGEGGLGVV
jgi:hypothetical protein